MSTHICIHSHVFTSRCSVAASNSVYLSSGFPNCPRASATSFLQQHLKTTEQQQSSNDLTNTQNDSSLH
jgi:hypothetical protein